MKTLGTILIVVCVIANIGIGYFLYKKAYIDNPNAPLVSLEDLNKLPSQHKEYSVHGVSFDVAGKYMSLGGQATTGLVDYIAHSDYKNNTDELPANLTLYVSTSQNDVNIKTSEEYKKISEGDFATRDKKYNFSYIDGGILEKNGNKLYFDVVELTIPDINKRVREKKITFFNKGNLYDLIWQDDLHDFDTSVSDFEKVVNSLKITQ